jgi:hypothetical protein
MRAFVSSCAERLPLLINSLSTARSSAVNRTTYFLTAISFPATNHLHRWLAATEIQKLPSFSMTEATSYARSEAIRLARLALSLDENDERAVSTAGLVTAMCVDDHETATDYSDRAVATIQILTSCGTIEDGSTKLQASTKKQSGALSAPFA